MPHKKTDKPPDYRNSLSLGIFVVVKDKEGRYLFVKHKYGLKKWSLPGGGFEQGEFFTHAGIREVLEESGLAVRITRHIGNFTLVQSKGAVIVYEATVIGGKLRADGKETSSCKFFTKEEAIVLHSKEKIYNAQLSAILWSELPPRVDGLPHEGWLTVPPTAT